jgi:6-phosphogluconolactonase
VVEDVPATFAEILRSVVGSAERAAIALSGGPTARACYERLATTDGIDWPRMECVLGDERCVPPDDPDSNERMIREVLADRLAEMAAFHPMDCSKVAEYSSLVSRLLPFDLVHLGLGPDGHTASIFPSSPALAAAAGSLVERNVDPSGRNEHERMTLTLEAINSSRLAVFTVRGKEKREALEGLLSGKDLPAARVRAERTVILCDAAALSNESARLVAQGAGPERAPGA